jgi:hypothetical protein
VQFIALLSNLPQIQITVTITQKPEIVGQRIIVNFFPVVAQKGGNEQQQCALWLVEVGKHSADYFEIVTRKNDYLR